ncbi:D-alanine--D-alanine ligase [Lutibaculum baratangense]|uniref:D-alanine--D-alanine ligase n=1 Tax=Lutibaculum baratangense AMV1 TaxID=631454 RepID=V4TNQ9_9HYPH|nr:D-alanine--D-alanine ligase [Lutibaculum baratangense]ESR27328.1 D-alanine--D-alanine ligase [Lutibaculum baratangense AMV1]
MTKHVAVLMGGWSAEREVSLSSGTACAKALEEAGYRVTKVDVDRTIGSVLQELKPDVVFNALHGPFGEDGKVQGLLEFLGIPYTHSGVLASALAMDKSRARTIFKAAGIPVAEGRLVDRLEAARRHVLPPPYVIKPNAEGSSFGVFIVPEGREHPPQELYSDEWKFGDEVLVERYVSGRELTCAVMGDVALGVIDIVPEQGFYDFQAKYAAGGSRHILPAEISPFVYQEVQRVALKAHQALGCRGVSRADFRYDERAEGASGLVCLEVNTQPGMTATSLVPEMAAHAGHSFPELVRWMVEDAGCNR